MRFHARLLVSQLLISAGLLLGACGGGEEATPAPRPTAAPQPTATRAPAPTVAPQPAATATPRAASTVAPPATPTPRPAARRPTGTLIVALSTFGTEDRDPITSSGLTMAIFGAPMYDFAIWHDKDGAPAPGVMERWEMASDGLRWTFAIRAMKFHNGEPITAEDVKFDLERALTPAASGQGATLFRAAVGSIDIPSPRTVVVQMKKPWPLMHFALTVGEGAQGTMYPKTAFERVGTKFFDQPVGSGPFKLVRYQPSVRFTYEATGEKHPYRSEPEYQGLELLLVTEQSTRVAMLRTGAANVIAAAPEVAPSLRRDNFPILEIQGQATANLRFWGLNLPDAVKAFPAGDVKVREALYLAINREEMVRTLLEGYASVPVREIIIPGVEGFDPSWKPVPYDPARAKELLAQAGYANGFTQKVYNTGLPGQPWTSRAGEVIAGYWAAIGVKSELVPIEYGSWRPYFRENPHRQALGAYGWIPANMSVSQVSNLESHYHSAGSLHPFTDRDIDAAVTRASSTLDTQERIASIRKIVDLVYKTFFSIPVAHASELYATSKDIAGWEPIKTANPGLFWETLRRK